GLLTEGDLGERIEVAAWPRVGQPSTAMRVAMDSADGGAGTARAIKGGGGVNEAQMGFFAAGARALPPRANAILATNWLIDKACLMPARDALRNGYDLGDDADKLRETDSEYKIADRLRDYIHIGRVYGGNAALFRVDSTNPAQWYENPHNPDGVERGAYKGITLVDLNWLRPVLEPENTQDPTSPAFYRPTYWRVGDLKIHHSHFCFFIPNPVTDYLKPAYNYMGRSVPDMISERVYAAERSANEAPML